MVELAHTAGKKLIAEGVETDKQLELLLSHNVDYLQGYLFSKPLAPIDMEKNLHCFQMVEVLVLQVAPWGGHVTWLGDMPSFLFFNAKLMLSYKLIKSSFNSD